MLAMICKIKKHQSSFVIIDKNAVQDVRLSLRARGLLAYLLCLPDNWVVVVSELQERFQDGRYSIQAAFKELELHGYATLETIRNELGQIAGKEWHIHEKPKQARRGAEQQKQVR